MFEFRFCNLKTTRNLKHSFKVPVLTFSLILVVCGALVDCTIIKICILQ